MYVELHARSAFSFLEGAALPEEYAALCAASEIPAMALLDRDGVYGAPRFHLAMQKLKLKAHIGAEITLPDGSQLPVLALNQAGYQNLCRLITRMKLRVPKHEPCSADFTEIAEYSNGLVCLTGGDDGPLSSAFRKGGTKPAARLLRELQDTFGHQNVYVELQRHLRREQELRNQAAVELARSLHFPLLATNGVRYATAEQRQILDVFTCTRNHRALATAGRLLSRNSECRLKSPREMEALFADLPEAIANTGELSSRLQFTLADLGYRFPQYPVPDGETMMSFLRKRTEEGARGRYLRENDRSLWPRARRQIERELKLIEKLKLEGYFLIVWDIVRYCRGEGILVQGRGSAANSAVCYALGITAVDPVGMDLLFERFLSEERGEWPDIDLDLPSGDDREKAIQYVYGRYGKLGAAMTANVITYRGRSAAREMGKALGFDGETLDRLAALVSSWEYKSPDDTLERSFRDTGFDLRHPRMRKFLELSLAVQDYPRHLGQHSGGMVVCAGQLDSVVPLEPATMPGRVVVQWDKDDCAAMGIVKVDLLGLGMMAVLKDCLELIPRHYGCEIDLAKLPANDPQVYAALQRADTVGMFQIESRAQMSCLPRLRPTRFYDIVVQVAIIRPGPIVGQMVNPYLQRRQGREPVRYPHPSLEPVLERTLGVPLFQEQLLRIAMIAAGFTGGEAEELRRAFGFKRSEKRMQEIEVKLRRGMDKNGIAPDAQQEIIQSILSFALYGFPESHAASFALIAYASAYLKCHYLGAFTAALLNNQPMGFYHPATIVKDAQRHGLKIRPLDITRSEWFCTLESGTADAPELRMGFRYAKGLREEAAEAILRERNRIPFTSISDLATRVPELRRAELVTLAEIGALNFIQPAIQAEFDSQSIAHVPKHRRDALWHSEKAARPPGPLLTGIAETEDISPLERMTPEERLLADFRGTGVTVGPHPMAYRRAELQGHRIRTAKDLESLPDGSWVRAAGCVIARQRPGTAKGFVFLSLEDETGIANAIVRPDIFEQNRITLVSARFLMVEGRLQKQDGVISVRAESIGPLPEDRGPAGARITEAETHSHDFH